MNECKSKATTPPGPRRFEQVGSEGVPHARTLPLVLGEAPAAGVICVTDKPGPDAYLPSMELDGCGCLTSEEHMTRCVLWVWPGLVLARPEEDRRALARERMTRWRLANPERWREIQRQSDVRRGRVRCAE